jgi:replicative superfamily II helicase
MRSTPNPVQKKRRVQEGFLFCDSSFLNKEAKNRSRTEEVTERLKDHRHCSAGCLPLWKSFVEELFQRGLIKAVFATETLAAGINMPARTTVLSTLSKRGDNGISMLTSNAMLQMAGRAGRRGIDTKGHVVSVSCSFLVAVVSKAVARCNLNYTST